MNSLLNLAVMMTAWASFAKDPQTGLLKLGWPTYDESSELHLREPRRLKLILE
jgi:hypothetical protein